MKIRVLTSKKAFKKNKIREYSGQYVTTLAALDNLKIAWKEYQVAKKEAAALQKTFLEDEIARKAQDRDVSKENMVKMMIKEERAIQEGIDSRQIRGRNNKQLVLKAEITDFITGKITTVYT